MTREIGPYLRLIFLAFDQIDEYVPATKDEYLKSRLIQDGILLQLFQVGENLARIRDLRPDLLETSPESWKRVIGLRNIIAHEYWRVDPELVWGYLDQDLLDLKASVEALEG